MRKDSMREDIGLLELFPNSYLHPIPFFPLCDSVPLCETSKFWPYFAT
jgi:hypothetical protein